MLNVSLSAYRLFGVAKFSAEQSESGYLYLTIVDTADAFPSAGQVRFQLRDADIDQLNRAVAAWNREMGIENQ